jgi:hypothetical protein
MSRGPRGLIHGGPTQMPHQQIHVEAITPPMSMEGQQPYLLAHAYNSPHVYQHIGYHRIKGVMHCRNPKGMGSRYHGRHDGPIDEWPSNTVPCAWFHIREQKFEGTV